MPGLDTPYVPRDEAFEPIKQESYFSNVIRGLVQRSVPDLLDHFRGSPKEFDSFDEIDQLYSEGLLIKNRKNSIKEFLEAVSSLPMFSMLPDAVRAIAEAATDQPSSILRYPRPTILSGMSSSSCPSLCSE